MGNMKLFFCLSPKTPDNKKTLLELLFINKYNEADFTSFIITTDPQKDKAKFLQSEFEKILKGDLSLIHISNSNKVLTTINKQNVLNSIQRYLDICKNFEIDTLSDVSTCKCIADTFVAPISDIKKLQIDVSDVNDELLELLNKKPDYLYQLTSRKFEEVIAEIFIRKNYAVELTAATSDGGKDIYVARNDELGACLYIVECKKYSPSHKVGVHVLRELYGVVSKEKATRGIVVTTSYFSKPAKEFQQELQFQMSLKDFDSIKQWLYEVTLIS